MNQEFESHDCEGDGDEQIWEDEGAPWIEQDGDNVDNEGNSNYRAYTPQLMDTHEIQALRTTLNRSEMQIQQQGHMLEYVPRKPASSNLRRWYGLPRNHGTMNRPVMSARSSSRPENSDLSSKLKERRASSARPTRAGVKTAEFARILKEEARQVRELECRYEDTKRSLLDVSGYIEVVTSCKPNDRVGGQDVYEQLADLISFAAQCGMPE